MTAISPSSPKATPRDWLGLAVIALPCMVYSMDLTVLNLAIPTLSAQFRPSAGQMLWAIDIYGFIVAGFLLTMGTLGDRIGRRRLLMIGAAAFAVASVIAAFAPTIETLIAARALLGLAGATLGPSTLSLISSMFRDGNERTFAISMWVASFSAGAVLGPLIGGMLIQHFWWGSVFLIAVPVMLALLVIGPVLLPEYRDPNAGRLDIVSAVLSLSAVLFMIFGIKHAAEFGADLIATTGVVGGAALFAVFINRQRRLADPMIDLKLFDNPAFGAALLINLTGILFMTGGFVFFAQYLQLVAGLSPLQAGLWSMPGALAFTICSLFTPALAQRFSHYSVIVGGLLLAAIGFTIQAFATTLEGIVLASLIFCVGFTPVITLSVGLIVGAAPPERAGAASAISETGVEIGGALGIALLGSLGTLLYSSAMKGVMLDGLSAAQAAGARATLAGALSAAAELPAGQAGPLIAAAREAFMGGFRASILLSIIGMLACALIAAAHLKGVRAADH